MAEAHGLEREHQRLGVGAGDLGLEVLGRVEDAERQRRFERLRIGRVFVHVGEGAAGLERQIEDAHQLAQHHAAGHVGPRGRDRGDGKQQRQRRGDFLSEHCAGFSFMVQINTYYIIFSASLSMMRAFAP